MPVVLRVKGYRFWFYSADLDEPPHVHVGRGSHEAKFWLSPVTVARPGNYREHELNEIRRILLKHHEDVMDAWQKEKNKRVNG